MENSTVITKLNDLLSPFAAKIGNQRHLKKGETKHHPARDGFKVPLIPNFCRKRAKQIIKLRLGISGTLKPSRAG
jgi:hypothetical protein